MKRLLKTLAAGLKGPRKSRPDPRARLGVQALEDRRLLSASPITDMTLWAQQFHGPTQSQNLWVNFDGKHNDGQNISAFVAQPGQNRDAAIQDILYRVQETFSPFNVQVRRMTGPGNYVQMYGDTTIFVGGDTRNLFQNGNVYTKSFAGYTPAGYSDYANPVRGLDHAPNSDWYDLGFYDPMQWQGNASDPHALDPTQWTNVRSDAQISQAIAHEAGHTFGLAHVLSGTTPDAMNYGSAGFQYFINQTLPVTTLNYDPATGLTAPAATLQPLSHVDFDVGLFNKIEVPVAITTQNSFTYLQTVLGQRYSDGYVHATDPNTVDPSSTNTHAPLLIGAGSGMISGGLGVGGTHGVLGRMGDFDAYQLYAARGLQFHIDVATNDILLAYPDVMVKDGGGNVLFFNHAATAWSNAHIDFQATAGQTYVVVVGSEDTSGRGGFTIAVTASDPVPVLTGATFTFSSPALPGAIGRLVVQSEDVNSGVFSGTYYNFMGLSTPVSGKVSNTSIVNGVATSDFSFNGSAMGGGLWVIAQYSGKLTGAGSPSGYGWADTLDGTLIDEVFLLSGMTPLWLWGGPATGKDF